jgi:hypothetical protein
MIVCGNAALYGTLVAQLGTTNAGYPQQVSKRQLCDDTHNKLIHL